MNVKLRAARETSGKTQTQVAKEVNITARTYQYYEYDKMEPRARMAVRVAKSVGSTVEKLWEATPLSHGQSSKNKEMSQAINGGA